MSVLLGVHFFAVSWFVNEMRGKFGYYTEIRELLNILSFYFNMGAVGIVNFWTFKMKEIE